MTASGWLIRMQLGGPYDCTIIDSYQYPTAGFAHPPRSCRVFTGVGRPTVGVASGNDLLQESPDGGPIRIDDIADLHLGILTAVRGRLLRTLDWFHGHELVLGGRITGRER
jgi:hypothetical protein